MAPLRIHLVVILALLLGVVVGARAQGPAADTGSALYDRPVLVVDPGMHTATIKRAAADPDGRWAVTASVDKTLRVWSLADGSLLRTIRMPAGPGNVGKVYAVAISPDGTLIAAAGWTRWSDADGQEQIYLFDRASGAILRRIEGLPNPVNHLAFSPDGRRLAAVLDGSNGLRVYGVERGWDEVAQDLAYGDDSYWVDFAHDGRLATTSFDGNVRLYSSGLVGDVRPAVVKRLAANIYPYGVAFSSDGNLLVVGDDDVASVDLLDGHTLEPLKRPDVGGIDNGILSKVAWSLDGQTLFAAGRYRDQGNVPVLAWSAAGTGPRRALQAGLDTVAGIVPLPGGDLLVASQDPWLARLGPDGTARWVHGPPNADFGNLRDSISVSSDGASVGFGFGLEGFGNVTARFDVGERKLTLAPAADNRMAVPRQDGLKIERWQNQYRPTLDGKPLPLDPYETSRSLAIAPTGDRFVLGTEWYLRAFNSKGVQLWNRAVPGVAWAVNITGDGRIVVAAYQDGTIRWHRMSDGAELLAFMPLPDRSDWVAWTPEGFYAATAGAHGVLRWHVNHGFDAPASSVAIEDIPGSYRPAVPALVLHELETPRALGLADLAEHNREVMVRTNSQVAPGARLHLLAVGIDAYKEDYAKNLRLNFADRDANDLASAIRNTQGSLYQVKAQVLTDEDANKPGILRALKTVRAGMAAGGGNDLAVIHFSGHGAMVEGKLYLLPYEADPRDDAGIESSGLLVAELRTELLEIGKYGRVLVLLDACHSGATGASGSPFVFDATALRESLAADNIAVLTSSRASELSMEDAAWQHGAFTKVLLDALSDPEADINRNGLISTTGLVNYLNKHVPALTSGKQTPGMEVRFEGTLFASGS